MNIKKLQQLWSIAEIETNRTKTQFSHVFDPIGLILFRPIKRELYESTPLNSLAFATTGGDGVHYSFILQEGDLSDNSPVVMTVPMNYGNENLIIGNNFDDFLCLGCEVGYFFLELLTYNNSRSEAIYWLTHPDEWFLSLSSDSENLEDLDVKKSLLKLLKFEFDLKPWDNIEERLEYLQFKYYSLLEINSG